jgi:hypothetical protein
MNMRQNIPLWQPSYKLFVLIPDLAKLFVDLARLTIRGEHVVLPWRWMGFE